MQTIKLVKDTINKNHIEKLIEWLKTGPRLTKGDLTIKFEKKWSEWLGVKYSVFVNSGSSANLAMIYSLIISKKLKNKKIIVPAVSWVTTVAPAIQLGLEPILCDCDKDNLGLDINHFEKLVREHNPAACILVHVLGIPNYMNEILNICKANDILLLEDTCESVGSEYENKKLGTFGLMSSFSFYFGHHMSTIEGGMICTDDDDFYHLLLSIRSHGWDRDLPTPKQNFLRQKYNLTDFRALYTFYYPGFNLRGTDLQAFLGIDQMDSLSFILQKRNENFELYNNLITKNVWKILPPAGSFVSNMNYPLITTKVNELVEQMNKKNIECRPLICGSIGEQPFWFENYNSDELPNAKLVHHNGIYLPNHHDLHDHEIEYICNAVNEII